MNFSKKVALGLGLTCLLAGLALASPDFTDNSARWAKAYNAGDAAAIVALYADDCHVMPPHAPAVTGTKALQAFLEKDFAGTRGFTLEITPVDSSKKGDLGYARGTWRMKDPSGAVLDSGSWVEVRKRVGGEWRILDDIWNSDRPMAQK